MRCIQVDEILAVARTVNGAEHSVRDMGLLVSAMERPRANVFGAELYPTLHEKAAPLLHSVARNHALIDGNQRTAWLTMRVFPRCNGVSASTFPPLVPMAGPFVEEVAQDNVDVPAIASASRPGSPFPDVRRGTREPPGSDTRAVAPRR